MGRHHARSLWRNARELRRARPQPRIDQAARSCLMGAHREALACRLAPPSSACVARLCRSRPEGRRRRFVLRPQPPRRLEVGHGSAGLAAAAAGGAAAAHVCRVARRRAHRHATERLCGTGRLERELLPPWRARPGNGERARGAPLDQRLVGRRGVPNRTGALAVPGRGGRAPHDR